MGGMNAMLQKPPHLWTGIWQSIWQLIWQNVRLKRASDRDHVHRNEGHGARLDVVLGEDGRAQLGQREHGQGKEKSAAVSQLAFHPDTTAVLGDQISCDEQSQP